jgi:hypothetical protein
MRYMTLTLWIGMGSVVLFSACNDSSVGSGPIGDSAAGGTTSRSGVDGGGTILLTYDGGVVSPEVGPTTPIVFVDAGQDLSTCHEENGLCGIVGEYCCPGFTCGSTNLNSVFHCLKNCVAPTECTTGCCAPLGTSGTTVCLPQAFCPSLFCRAEEQTCQGELACCEGLACAILGTTTKTSACKKICTQHDECATGCCSLLGTSGIKVCLPQSYCPSVFCRVAEQTCQGENPCCDGLTCAIFPATSTTPATSACKKICKENIDCPTDCCVSLGVDAPSACLEKSYCPKSP